MKIRTILSIIPATAILILFITCKNNENTGYPFKIKFITENYKPLNYVENSILTGLAPDVLKNICNGLNIPYNVEVLPWSEGYNMALKTDNVVLFSTVLNTDRKDLFKWAGPIASLDWSFYTSSLSQITINTLDDAKKAGKIGVLKDYAVEQYLVREGFTNLVYCTDNIQAFDRLLKGEIDLFPSEKITAEAALNSLNKSIYSVTEKLTIRTDLVYFAFNKNIPDDVIADFQREIDQLKGSGILRTLTQKYLNSSDDPGTLQIYTENYPPITFRNSFGEITGFGSDVAIEIMKRNRLFIDIKLSLWSRTPDCWGRILGCV